MLRRPRQDSNLRPPSPQPGALSAELRGQDCQLHGRRYGVLAGREGFEPSVEFYPDNHLAGGPDRPLRHLPGVTIMAEGEGFEPPVRFPPQLFSRQPP